jgi:hypothetical protein
MKFVLWRASGYRNPGKPCKNAYEEKNIYGALLWYIDINSMEELIALIKEVDDKLIVSDEDITIYDDYVE